jgi:hypothetical protein
MAPTDKDQDWVHGVLRRLLYPAVRVCLRYQIRIQDIQEIMKQVFVDVSVVSMRSAGDKPNASSVSLATGVHRKDVTRLLKNESPSRTKGNVITRIIGQWQHDPRYCRKSGGGRVLSFDKGQGEFARLVSSVSGELNPYSVLKELERMQAACVTPRGIRLESSFNQKGQDVSTAFDVLAKDSQDLTRAVEENTAQADDIAHLHLRTEFDNVDPGKLNDIRSWLLKEGSLFHRKVRTYLARFDKDINPKNKRGGSRVVVGAFSFSEQDNESLRGKK